MTSHKEYKNKEMLYKGLCFILMSLLIMFILFYLVSLYVLTHQATNAVNEANKCYLELYNIQNPLNDVFKNANEEINYSWVLPHE